MTKKYFIPQFLLLCLFIASCSKANYEPQEYISTNLNDERIELSKEIFNKLKNTKPSKEGEIHITDAIQALIKDKEKFIAHNFLGKYLDCGTMQGYIKSTLEINKS